MLFRSQPGAATGPGIITAATTSPQSVSSVPDAPGTTAPLATTTTLPPPPVIAVFGDSVPAWLLRDGAAGFSRTDLVLVNGAIEACDGIVDGPQQRDRRGDLLPVPEGCVAWNTWYPEVIGRVPHVDAALLMVGLTGVVDAEVDGRWIGPCDSLGWYVDDIAARIDALRGR